MTDPTTRRDFFGGAAKVAVGGAAAMAMGGASMALGAPPDAGGSESLLPHRRQVPPEARLRELGIELPAAPRPVATYVPAVPMGTILYVAGHTPRLPDGSPGFQAKVGDDFTVEEGREAARAVGMGSLPGGMAVEIETFWQIRV